MNKKKIFLVIASILIPVLVGCGYAYYKNQESIKTALTTDSKLLSHYLSKVDVSNSLVKKDAVISLVDVLPSTKKAVLTNEENYLYQMKYMVEVEDVAVAETQSHSETTKPETKEVLSSIAVNSFVSRKDNPDAFLLIQQGERREANVMVVIEGNNKYYFKLSQLYQDTYRLEKKEQLGEQITTQVETTTVSSKEKQTEYQVVKNPYIEKNTSHYDFEKGLLLSPVVHQKVVDNLIKAVEKKKTLNGVLVGSLKKEFKDEVVAKQLSTTRAIEGMNNPTVFYVGSPLYGSLIRRENLNIVSLFDDKSGNDLANLKDFSEVVKFQQVKKLLVSSDVSGNEALVSKLMAEIPDVEFVFLDTTTEVKSTDDFFRVLYENERSIQSSLHELSYIIQLERDKN